MILYFLLFCCCISFFFFSSRRRHTRCYRDWSSDVCSSDLVDARRQLLPLPVARVRNALTGFRRRTDELGAERALAVGTSAVRDSGNGEAFLGEVEWSYGFSTRLLSGAEEADLTFRGATLGRNDVDGTMVVDLGGGSTELVMDGRSASVDIGSVRMTEQLGEDVDAIAAEVGARLPAGFAPRKAIG